MKKQFATILMIAALMVPMMAGAKTIEMQVNGLVCAFCAQGIEKHLRKEAATEDVFVSLKNSLVGVALKPDADITDERLRTILQDAGYTVVNIKRTKAPIAELRRQVKP
jgi:mercuric ion binding protein